VTSYTLYLEEIDEGRSANVPAPAIARHYWKMADDATLRDVVLAVRNDEAHHRDVNHGFADTIAGLPLDKPNAVYPPHATERGWTSVCRRWRSACRRLPAMSMLSGFLRPEDISFRL
jgi:hypothetical protein